jgi:hypothetical protein
VPHAPRFVVGVRFQNHPKLSHEASNRAPVAAWELCRIDKDETMMGLTSLVSGIGERGEVGHIFSDDGAPFSMSKSK